MRFDSLKQEISFGKKYFSINRFHHEQTSHVLWSVDGPTMLCYVHYIAKGIWTPQYILSLYFCLQGLYFMVLVRSFVPIRHNCASNFVAIFRKGYFLFQHKNAPTHKTRPIKRRYCWFREFDWTAHSHQEYLGHRPQAWPYHPPSVPDHTNSLIFEWDQVPAARSEHFYWKHFPQEHVACVIKSCNGTKLILAHLNSLLGEGWLCLLKPRLVICESPVNSQGLVSVKQAVARCLCHILFILCHFFPFAVWWF